MAPCREVAAVGPIGFRNHAAQMGEENNFDPARTQGSLHLSDVCVPLWPGSAAAAPVMAAASTTVAASASARVMAAASAPMMASTAAAICQAGLQDDELRAGWHRRIHPSQHAFGRVAVNAGVGHTSVVALCP